MLTEESSRVPDPALAFGSDIVCLPLPPTTTTTTTTPTQINRNKNMDCVHNPDIRTTISQLLIPKNAKSYMNSMH